MCVSNQAGADKLDTRFEFTLTGIGAKLGATRLGVPIYQRSYAWGENGDRNQVEEFWEDLRSNFVVPAAEYFLGTIVLSKGGVPGRVSIIDGQQRLATTAILLAAMRDEFRDRGDVERARIIEEKFLAKADLRSGELTPQLVLNADDDVYFRKAILDGQEGVAKTQTSHRLIEAAYNLLRGYIKAAADDASTAWRTRLLDWIDYLSDRVIIITVEVPTEADAFLIFETLNDRGADLTIADLLKNYLFGRAGDQLDSVRNSWVSALANLDIPAAGSQLFTDFLRHYWSSKYGATRERELYARIKDRITTATHAVEFANELQTASRFYDAVLHSDHELWFEQTTVDRSNIDVLGVLNLEQNRPLMLAAMQHLDSKELSKMLRAMISWGIRGLLVGGIGGGTAERRYCEAAMKVRSGAIKTAYDLQVELATIIHSDDAFKKGFSAARITRGTLARYVLVALERTATGEKEPELVPNQDESQVNLEHILPRNPKAAEWPKFNAEQRVGYLHRIGNLALLSKGKNDKIGNKPFADKQPILAASDLQLTKAAGSEAEWTPEIIATRQAKMADLAVKTWPLLDK